MKHLGNLAANHLRSVPFECALCEVSWDGCAAAADCPKCGAQFDWHNPSAAPFHLRPHPWDLRWIWQFGDRAGLSLFPRGYHYSIQEGSACDWRKVYEGSRLR